MRASAGYLADLLTRFASRFKGLAIAPLVLGLGCQAGDASSSAPAAKVSTAPAEVTVDQGPRALGAFNVTFYYVIGEEEVGRRHALKTAAANDNRVSAKSGATASGSMDNGSDDRADDGADGGADDGADDDEAGVDLATKIDLAAVTPPARVTLYAGGGDCTPIAEVSREFAHQIRLQGTGKLKDGRVLNIFGACSCDHTPCYKVIEQQWGTSGTGRALTPFRTVAVDPKVIKLGSLLYVPVLEGRVMPGRAPWGGFIHDGCVVADDTGGGIKDHQIDLFVGRKGWFHGMSGRAGSHAWAKHVPVYDGSRMCERNGRRVARKSGAI